MPYLRATRGRLITISSVRGVIGQPFNEGYSAAKFAIEGFMEALAPVAAQVGVTVSLIEPAAVLDTEFVNNSSGPDPAALLAEPGPTSRRSGPTGRGCAPARSRARRWRPTWPRSSCAR